MPFSLAFFDSFDRRCDERCGARELLRSAVVAAFKERDMYITATRDVLMSLEVRWPTG